MGDAVKLLRGGVTISPRSVGYPSIILGFNVENALSKDSSVKEFFKKS